MKARRIYRAVLLAAGAALVVRYHLLASPHRIDRPPTLEELHQVFTGQVNGTLVKKPIPHYRGTVETARESVPAFCVSTAHLPPRVKGYVDEMNLLVVIDPQGVVRKVKLIESRETPAYLRKVLDSGFLDRFAGKHAGELKEKVPLDAVTGATITAKAIRDDVAAAASLAARELLGMKIPAPSLPSWKDNFRSPRFLAVLAALLFALFARVSPWPRKGRREAAWIISILLIGVYAMTPWTLVHTFQFLRLDFPGPGNGVVALIGAFVLVSTLAAGPLWCGYACPFGALQELLSKLPVKKWKPGPTLTRIVRESRFLFLFAAVAAAFGLGIAAAAEWEPFYYLFGRSRDPVAWLFIALVLGTSLFVKRFWCRFFCPTGTCLLILSSHRRFFRRVKKGVELAEIELPESGLSEINDHEKENTKEEPH